MPSLMDLLKPILFAVLSIGSGIFFKQHRLALDRFVMAIVRDLGRFKARRRRLLGASKGSNNLIRYLHHNDPLEELRQAVDETTMQNLPTYTLEELHEFGSNGEPTLLVAVLGRVFDVSSGSKFYGAQGPYAGFAGHDVTYALSTGCRTADCIETLPDELSDKQLVEAQRWLAFFHLHDKYKLVGKIEKDYFAELLEQLDLDSANASMIPLLQPKN